MTDTLPTGTVSRVCSECGNQLGADASPKRITCGDDCRKARSRRLKRESGELPWPDPDRHSKNATPPPHHKRLQEAINNEMDDAVHETLQEELRPVVREAITEDVLRSIQSAVGLVPSALSAIQEDLGSSDAVLRQRAATLLLKYTLGHPALIPDANDDGHKQIIVNFEGMHRPPEVTGQPAVTVEAEEVESTPNVLPQSVDSEDELRECDNCGASKPDSEFVENSDRCVKCFEEQQALAESLLGEE